VSRSSSGIVFCAAVQHAGKLRITPAGLLHSGWVGGDACSSQTSQSTSSKGIHPRRVVTLQLRRTLTRRPPRNTPGAWPAHAQLRRAQRHPLAATGSPRMWLMPTSPRGSTSWCPLGVAADRAIRTAPGAPVWTARAHGPSVIASRNHHSRCAFDRSLTSPNTLGRQTPMYG
jgi:hypothetical protein